MGWNKARKLMGRTLAGVVCALLLVLGGGTAIARADAGPPTVVVEDGLGSVRLDGRMVLLRDSTNQLTIDEVSHPDNGALFHPVPPGILSAGFDDATYWFKARLANRDPIPQDWILEVERAFLDYVDLYLPDERGGFLRFESGNRRPFSSRDIAYRTFAFEVTLPPQAEQLVYLRVETRTTVRVSARLWEPTAFLEMASRYNLLAGVSLGMIAALFLLSLGQFVEHRSRLWGLFTLYQGAAGLLYFTLNGYSAQYLFPDAPDIARHLVGVGTGSAIGLFALFTARLLDVGRLHRMLRPFLHALGVAALLSIVTVFFDRRDLIAEYLHMINLLVLTTGLAASLYLAKQGDRVALNYLIGFSIPLVFASWRALLLLGIPLPIGGGGDFLARLLELGYIFQIVFVGRGINLQLAALKDERNAARQAELEAARQAEAEREKRAEQRALLSMMSHEFRTPLAVIEGATEVLPLYLSADNKAAHDVNATILRSAKRLLALVETCLADDVVDAALLNPTRQSFDLVPLVRSICEDGAHLPPMRRLSLHLPEACPIVGDPHLLRVAIANLVDNALKYSPETSPVTLSLGMDRAQAVVTVRDEGIGIAPEEHEAIFRRYHRTPAGRSKGGAGLGLNLVARIVALHRGTVSLDSREGRGATFSIVLPLIPDPPCASSQRQG